MHNKTRWIKTYFNIELFIKISLILFAFYPIIPEKMESILVILLSGVSLLYFIINYKSRKISAYDFLISSSLFIIFYISAILSDNSKEAFVKIETMLSLIVLPIVFNVFLGNFKSNIPKILNAFQHIYYLITIIYSLIVLYHFSFYRNPKFPIKDANFFRNVLLDIPLIGEHPIYSSIFIAIAIIIGIKLYNIKNILSLKNILILLGHFILVGLLLILMSKGVLIGLIVAILISAFYFSNFFYKYFLAIVLIVGIGFMLPSENNRFKQLIDKETYSNFKLENSTSVRLSILACNVKLIKEKIYLGYGVGDVQDNLNQCYSSKAQHLAKAKYNSHNQYLFLWLSSGLVGLAIFILYLFFYFKIAKVNKSYIMLSILCLYCIVFMIENVLSRQSGVILFSFLINLYAWAFKIQKSNFENK
jgi:O-antigen ligase